MNPLQALLNYPSTPLQESMQTPTRDVLGEATVRQAEVDLLDVLLYLMGAETDVLHPTLPDGAPETLMQPNAMTVASIPTKLVDPVKPAKPGAPGKTNPLSAVFSAPGVNNLPNSPVMGGPPAPSWGASFASAQVKDYYNRKRFSMATTPLQNKLQGSMDALARFGYARNEDPNNVGLKTVLRKVVANLQ